MTDGPIPVAPSSAPARPGSPGIPASDDHTAVKPQSPGLAESAPVRQVDEASPKRLLPVGYAHASENPSERQPELIESAERVIRGVVSFGLRFLRTLMLAAFRPGRLEHSSRLSRPYSFVAMAALLGMRGLRYAVILFFVSLSTFRTCTPGTRSDTMVEPFHPPLRMLFTLPDLTEVVLWALPLIVALVALVAGVTRLGRRRVKVSEETLFARAAYAVGLQQVTLAAFSGLVIYANRAPSNETSTWGPEWVWNAVPYVVFLAWPAWGLWLALAPDRTAATRRMRILLSALGYAVLSLAILSATAATSVAVAVPFAIWEWKRLPHPGPVLRFRPIYVDSLDPKHMRLTAWIRNGAYTALILRGDNLEFVRRYSDNSEVKFTGAVESWNGARTPLIHLDSAGQGWLTAVLEAHPTVKYHHDVPKKSTDQIAFREFARSHADSLIVANDPPSDDDHDVDRVTGVQSPAGPRPRDGLTGTPGFVAPAIARRERPKRPAGNPR